MIANTNTFAQADARETWMAANFGGANAGPQANNAKAAASWLATVHPPARQAAPVVVKAAPAMPPQPAPIDLAKAAIAPLLGTTDSKQWAAEFTRCNTGFDPEIAELWLSGAIVCGLSHATWARQQRVADDRVPPAGVMRDVIDEPPAPPVNTSATPTATSQAAEATDITRATRPRLGSRK